MIELTKRLTELNQNTSDLSMALLDHTREMVQKLLTPEDWEQINSYCDKHQKRRLTVNDFACFTVVLIDCLQKQDGFAPYARFTAWSKTEQAEQVGISEWCNCHLTPMFVTLEASNGITLVEDSKRGNGNGKRGTCRRYKATAKFNSWIEKKQL